MPLLSCVHLVTALTHCSCVCAPKSVYSRKSRRWDYYTQCYIHVGIYSFCEIGLQRDPQSGEARPTLLTLSCIGLPSYSAGPCLYISCEFPLSFSNGGIRKKDRLQVEHGKGALFGQKARRVKDPTGSFSVHSDCKASLAQFFCLGAFRSWVCSRLMSFEEPNPLYSLKNREPEKPGSPESCMEKLKENIKKEEMV